MEGVGFVATADSSFFSKFDLESCFSISNEQSNCIETKIIAGYSSLYMVGFRIFDLAVSWPRQNLVKKDVLQFQILVLNYPSSHQKSAQP